MFSQTVLNVQATRALLFTKSLCSRCYSQQFRKAQALRRVSNYKITSKCTLKTKELAVFPLTGVSVGNCHQKLHYTTYNEKDAISEEKDSSSLDFTPGFSNGGEETSASASVVKVHSGFAEYTLNEDGYLEIKDLVDFLKKENAIDICVIRTSEDKRNYVDYFVVVSGVSSRHLRAMAKNLEQLAAVIQRLENCCTIHWMRTNKTYFVIQCSVKPFYQHSRSLRHDKFSSIWGFNPGDDGHFLFQFRGHEVRGIGRDGHVVVEGLESDHWVAVDIGNIVVHFFLPEVREVYELEKLWTLGPKYDDQSKDMLEREKFLRAAEFGTTLEENVNETDG